MARLDGAFVCCAKDGLVLVARYYLSLEGRDYYHDRGVDQTDCDGRKLMVIQTIKDRIKFTNMVPSSAVTTAYLKKWLVFS